MHNTFVLPLYIDPGTGSMLFSILIGLAAAATFGAKALFLRIKFMLSGGKNAKEMAEAQKKIPYVIYSDHKRYWNVFKPVCDEFERRQIPLVFYTSSPDDPALEAGYTHVKTEFIGEGNMAFAKLNFLNAGILLATTPGLDVYQWKRSKNVNWYVHIPHLVDDLTTYRMFGLDYFDAILLNGAHQEERIRYFENARNIKKKELPVTGSTYMDTMLEKSRKYDSTGNNGKNILLAPSWGKTAILSRFGSKIIKALADTGYNIIIRPHPQSITSEKEMLASLTEEFKGCSNVSWNYDNDNFAVLAKSSIMITDFSGIIFDYSFIFNKPLIYADTTFDSLPYDADWLAEGDQPWCFKILPEIGIKLEEKDFGKMKEIIDDALGNETMTEIRNKVKAESWLHQGEAAKLTVDYMVNKLKELEEDK